MVDWSKPIQTRAGDSARVICTDMLSTYGAPIVVLVSSAGKTRELLLNYKNDGLYRGYTSKPSELDIINASDIKKTYRRVYRTELATYGTSAYSYNSIKKCKDSASVEDMQRFDYCGIIEETFIDGKYKETNFLPW
jgi:hypothetical protein